MPLMEIVTDPVIRTAEAARRYAEELRLLLVTIGASDAAMENGQMRVEANVSLRPVGQEAFGTRVEVKNMNSFRAVERAIEYEIERQEHALRTDQSLVQETRGWDDGRGITYRMRVKETSEDYRYFPEPDLPPLRVDPAWLAEIRSSMPELPSVRRQRYQSEFGLSAYDAGVISSAASAYFDAAVTSSSRPAPKRVANLLTKIGLRLAKSDPDMLSDRDPEQLARVAVLVDGGELSSQNAEQVYEEHLRSAETVDAIVARLGLRQISDQDALTVIVTRVLDANPAAVADVAAGKTQAIGFLTGQVMKETRGQANAARVGELLRAELERRG
jgi:aspartyl-tRNA(Asn)/glutamyl-tRNA(Gln) amidotransferase subunit B